MPGEGAGVGAGVTADVVGKGVGAMLAAEVVCFDGDSPRRHISSERVD